MTEPLIAVVGATATGKTGVGVALARALGGEIVGADSRQVYRGMAIGTAQPSREELAAAPHHLVGDVAPDEPFGLVDYLQRARAAIAEIRARGRLPILVGGTGQYVWALLEQWSIPRVPPDPVLREELALFAAERGAVALHDRLRSVDPAAAEAIHPNNVRRVIRALEVFQHSGMPISEQQWRNAAPAHAVILGLDLDREALYRRIDERVVQMYRHGLLDELRALEAAGFGPNLPSMASIGYPEAWAVLRGEIDVAGATERTQTATHRLARQQRTWFRAGDPRIAWLDAAGAAERAVALVRGRLARDETGD